MLSSPSLQWSHFKNFLNLRSKRFRAVLGAKNEERESKTAQKIALARPKPKIPFLSLSLLRNQTETLATQTRILSKDSNLQQL